MSVNISSVIIWDYYENNRRACLDNQLDKTLASLRLVDKQSLLVEVKVSTQCVATAGCNGNNTVTPLHRQKGSSMPACSPDR